MRGLADEILESRRLRDTFKYRWSTLQSELGVLKAHLKYLEEPDISLRLLSSVDQELNDRLLICDAGQAVGQHFLNHLLLAYLFGTLATM